MPRLTRKTALSYVAYRVDDALNGSKAGAADVKPGDRLVGWQCGFEPLFVAVGSSLPNVRVDDDEAEEIAIDYLKKIGWFGSNDVQDPDYVL